MPFFWAILFFALPSSVPPAQSAPPVPAQPASIQSSSVQDPTPPPVPVKPHTAKVSSVVITVGRGELMQFPDFVERVAISEPNVADIVAVGPQEVMINAKAPGLTTALIWFKGGLSRYEVTVRDDLTLLEQQIKESFPSESIHVASSKEGVMLTGVVSSQEVVQRALSVASLHSKHVVNLLQAPQAEERQVMLQVKFGAVDRDKLSQLGMNVLSTNPKIVGGLSTQQFSSPRVGNLQFQNNGLGIPQLQTPQVSVSSMLNLFAFRPDLNVGLTVQALQENNLLEILAEPNLITVSGKAASFLAGGEFPFPVLTTTGTGGASAPVVTIQFRKFGVGLDFTPTVQPNGVIHLKVKPEVSSLDFTNALTIQGFTIPAISTRQAETEVDLHDGESFAIAGLIDNRVTDIVDKFPILGSIPILGKFFSSHSTERVNSELLVVVTPRFVHPMAVGEKPPVPKFPKDFLDKYNPSKEPKKKGKFVGPRGHEDAPATPAPAAKPGTPDANTDSNQGAKPSSPVEER
jgi:pilus assembly protein CpaC